jgi:hypothetical protein
LLFHRCGAPHRTAPHRTALHCRLYRDSTQYVNGRHVRDLSKLNRDMRQVLFITADPNAYELQPENAIKVRGGVVWGGVMQVAGLPCRHAPPATTAAWPALICMQVCSPFLPCLPACPPICPAAAKGVG